MQGDVLVPDYLWKRKCCVTSVSNFLLSFVLCVCVLLVFFCLLSFIYIRLVQTICSLGAAVHTLPSAFHSFSPRQVLWFWLVLLVCPACPLWPRPFWVWVVLCPFRRATFIGWCPLEPPRCSLGGVRWGGGALLVLLFLLFDLLNDLSDPPLCSLARGQWKWEELTRHNRVNLLQGPMYIIIYLAYKYTTKSLHISSTIKITWFFVILRLYQRID